MPEEIAPPPHPAELPSQGPFAPGWFGRAAERVLTLLVAAGLFYILHTQTTPRKPPSPAAPAATAQAQPAAAGAARGNVVVQFPPGTVEEALRVSVLHDGIYAAPEEDLLMRLLAPVDLGQAPLPPGDYMVVVSYREHVLPGVPVKVQPGRTTTLQVPRRELARIEYETALARQAGEQNADVEHFQRVVTLDPEHVDARLQLAAHALATGSPEEAKVHLAVVERRAPRNSHAAEIRRVLARFAPR